MPKTISQIAGDYGLDRNMTSDPFARTEKAVTDVTKKTLNELRSQQDEINAAKGFGRSTFTDQIQAKKEADIVGQLGVQFAQARQTEDLAERAFQRNTISQAVAGDIQTGLVKEQGTQTRLNIGEQGTESRLNIGAQGTESRLNIGAQGTESRLNIGAQGTETRKNIIEQGEVQSDLIEDQGTQTRKNITKQGIETRLTSLGGTDTVTGEEVKGTIDTTAEANAQAQMDVLDKHAELLPAELRERVSAQKDIISDKLQLTRESAYVDTAVNLAMGFAFEFASSLGGGKEFDFSKLASFIYGGNNKTGDNKK